MTYGPYKVKVATFDPLEQRGGVRFADGQDFAFRTRIDAKNRRRTRLLSHRLEIPVCSPPRFDALVAWLDAKHPLTTV